MKERSTQATEESRKNRRVLRIFSTLKVKIVGNRRDPQEIFPTELAEEIRKGAAVPVLYSGPIYIEDPERMEQVEDELDRAYDKVRENYDHSLTPLQNAIRDLEAELPKSAFRH